MKAVVSLDVDEVLDLQAYHASVSWGRLADCSSWQPPPRWRKSSNVIAPAAAATASGLTDNAAQPSSLRDVAQQSVASVPECDLQDQPCVLPATDCSTMHSSANEPSTFCHQQQIEATNTAALPADSDEEDMASTPTPQKQNRLSNKWKSRQLTACYRLRVACTAANDAWPEASFGCSRSHSQSACQCCQATGFAYHIPPRLR